MFKTNGLARWTPTHLLVYAALFVVALPPAYVVESIFWAEAAFAAGFSDGQARYQKGDFKGAEKILTQALKGASGAERARIFKLLGICQFILGNTAAAGGSFKRALALNPALKITAAEAYDPSVIPFFNKQRGTTARPAAAAQPKKAAPAGPAATAKAATAVSAPAAKSTPTINAAGKSRAVNRTTLRVDSNVSDAKVWVDGLIRGDVNQPLDMDPGQALVEIQRQGFVTKKLNLTIAANRETKLTVNLEKPKPKPKPKPAPKAQQAVAQKSTSSAVGDETAAAAGIDAASTRKPAKRPKKKPEHDPFAPDPGGDFYADQPTPQGPDAAQQFQMDQTGPGGYAAPAPQAPMSYGYMAPPPPVYYAPPPTYYAPPPPPPPPAIDYAGTDPYAAPPVAAEPAADPGALPDPAAADAGDKDKKCVRGSFLIALVPFGAGQFQNCNILLGAAFLAAEGGLFYLWYSTKSELDASIKSYNTYEAQYQDKLNDTDPNNDPTAEETKQRNTYLEQTTAYKADGEKQQSMYLYGAIGVMALGVVEAIIHMPSAKPTKKKKKRRYSGFGALPDGSTSGSTPHYALVDTPSAEAADRRYDPALHWGVKLLPSPFLPALPSTDLSPNAAFEVTLKF